MSKRQEDDGYFDERAAARYEQGLTSHHFEIVDGRAERLSIPFRYAWPSGST
jgi:hypothetical protein